MNDLLTYRRESGLTQKEMAEILKVSQGFICLIEKGGRAPGIDLAMRIERLLGYRPAWKLSPRASGILNYIPPLNAPPPKKPAKRLRRRSSVENCRAVSHTPPNSH